MFGIETNPSSRSGYFRIGMDRCIHIRDENYSGSIRFGIGIILALFLREVEYRRKLGESCYTRLFLLHYLYIVEES